MEEINVETVVAIISAVIALMSVLTSIYYNHRTTKTYREGLRPILRFDLIEKDTVLYLKVTNMGHSAAINIVVDINKMTDNGNNYIDRETMYDYDTFDLYPTESIEAIVSTLDVPAFTWHPIIYLNTKYEEQLSGKIQTYDRKVTCNFELK